MKQRAGFIALALVASLAAVAPAGAVAGKAKGAIIIEGLTLAGTQFGTPSMQPTTVATDPVSIPVTEGDTFTYSTITCDRSPPWKGYGQDKGKRRDRPAWRWGWKSPTSME